MMRANNPTTAKPNGMSQLDFQTEAETAHSYSGQPTRTTPPASNKRSLWDVEVFSAPESSSMGLHSIHSIAIVLASKYNKMGTCNGQYFPDRNPQSRQVKPAPL